MKAFSYSKIVFFLIFGQLILTSCNSDEDSVTDNEEVEAEEEVEKEEEEAAVNKPPADFNLTAVANNATEVDLLPTLEWEAAIDPDGDIVNYDFYFGTTEEKLNLLAENIIETTFTFTESLSLYENYFWKVVAKDKEEASTSSVTNTFGTRGLNFSVAPITVEANFSKRNNFSTAVFDDKIWVVGGVYNTDKGIARANDVWSSEDGNVWLENCSNAPFVGRSGHVSIDFKGKLWVIGGSDGSNRFNDTWVSPNGVDWELVGETGAVKFSERRDFSVAVFKDRLWIIGGQDKNVMYKNDVWYSEDGETWIEATSEAPFSPRSIHTTVVFDNKLWVIGGWGENLEVTGDIWYSEDGINWIEAIDEAEFGPRRGHTSVVYDNKIWVISGTDAFSERKNDFWYSSDGISWENATEEAPFAVRTGHGSVVFDNKIWVFAGFGLVDDVQRKNDVWAFD